MPPKPRKQPKLPPLTNLPSDSYFEESPDNKSFIGKKKIPKLPSFSTVAGETPPNLETVVSDLTKQVDSLKQSVSAKQEKIHSLEQKILSGANTSVSLENAREITYKALFKGAALQRLAHRVSNLSINTSLLRFGIHQLAKQASISLFDRPQDATSSSVGSEWHNHLMLMRQEQLTLLMENKNLQERIQEVGRSDRGKLESFGTAAAVGGSEPIGFGVSRGRVELMEHLLATMVKKIELKRLALGFYRLFFNAGSRSFGWNLRSSHRMTPSGRVAGGVELRFGGGQQNRRMKIQQFELFINVIAKVVRFNLLIGAHSFLCRLSFLRSLNYYDDTHISNSALDINIPTVGNRIVTRHRHHISKSSNVLGGGLVKSMGLTSSVWTSPFNAYSMTHQRGGVDDVDLEYCLRSDNNNNSRIRYSPMSVLYPATKQRHQTGGQHMYIATKLSDDNSPSSSAFASLSNRYQDSTLPVPYFRPSFPQTSQIFGSRRRNRNSMNEAQADLLEVLGNTKL